MFIVHVEPRRERDLTEIGEAGGALTFFFSAAECWKQEGGKDGNNADDNQQLEYES